MSQFLMSDNDHVLCISIQNNLSTCGLNNTVYLIMTPVSRGHIPIYLNEHSTLRICNSKKE